MGVNIFVEKYIPEMNWFVEDDDFDWDRKGGDNTFANTVKTKEIIWDHFSDGERCRPNDIEQAVLWLFRNTDEACFNRLMPVLKDMTKNPNIYFNFYW